MILDVQYDGTPMSICRMLVEANKRAKSDSELLLAVALIHHYALGEIEKERLRGEIRANMDSKVREKHGG